MYVIVCGFDVHDLMLVICDVCMFSCWIHMCVRVCICTCMYSYPPVCLHFCATILTADLYTLNRIKASSWWGRN